MTRETGLHLVSLGFRVCGSCQFRGFPQHTLVLTARPNAAGLWASGSNVEEGSGLDRSLVGR